VRLSKIGEFGLIKKLRSRCRNTPPEILTGIGDDSAAIKIGNRKILVTTDMLIEGIHFDLSYTTFFQLGYKLLAVNISDIFAMGGYPKYFFISLGIPKRFKPDDIGALYSGILKLAKKYDIAIAGGDTCASEKGLVLNGTLIGTAGRIVTRAGARAGDGIFVTDTLGDSAMGLELLKRQKAKGERQGARGEQLFAHLIKKHLMPEPTPVKDIADITSMIDISDGLLIDLSHICDESKAGAVIHRNKIPLSRELADAAKISGLDPLRFALKGGEDYALLFTAPQDIKTNAFRIGEIVRKGRFIMDEKGRKTRFKAEGYEHFKE